MKLIIAGGRDYFLSDWDYCRLDVLHARYNFEEEVCGDATGADTGGKHWAQTRGIPVHMMPADWNRYKRAAGFIRNREMADYIGKGNMLVAFPGNRGTANMVEVAREVGLIVKDWRYPSDEVFKWTS